MMITISPLDIEGFTGVGERMDAELDAALRRWAAEHPSVTREEGQTEGMRLSVLMDTAARYADVRDRLAHEQVARAERDRLLHQVELRWEALSAATDWLAAHHAYVLAVDEARIAIDMWRERAEAALRRPFFCSSPRDEAAYRQIQEAGHPALEQAVSDLDQKPAQTAEQLRANSTRSTSAAWSWPPRPCATPRQHSDRTRRPAPDEGAHRATDHPEATCRTAPVRGLEAPRRRHPPAPLQLHDPRRRGL
jgi:hypothetical protein